MFCSRRALQPPHSAAFCDDIHSRRTQLLRDAAADHYLTTI
jgi:hypothetical protein